MTHPSEPAAERGEVEGLILQLQFVMARTVANDDAAAIETAIAALASLSVEVERLRNNARPGANSG